MSDRRGRRRRVLLAAGVLAATALGFGVSPGAASAAPAASAARSAPAPSGSTALAGHIMQVAADDTMVRLLFRASGLGADQSLDPASVRVDLDATTVPAHATVVGTAPGKQVARTAMLVLDVSGSMRGAGIAGARQAATAFLDAVPADVKVGLVTVSTTATVAVPPTTNRSVMRNRVAGLQAIGNTALYDGTLLALHQLGSDGSRTIVLLTDGHDEGSRTTIGQLVTAIRAANGVSVDAVSFGTAAAQVAPLQQLTSAAGGRILATNEADDFAAAFGQAAHDIATELLVTVNVPKAFAGRAVNVTVTALAGGTRIGDTVFSDLPAPPTPTVAPTPAGPRPVSPNP